MEESRRIKDRERSVVETYKEWIAAVTGYINEAAGLLESHGARQAVMISMLRERLARAEGMRRKDFDNAFRGILCGIHEKEEKVRRVLEDLRREEEDVIDALGKVSSEGGCAAVEPAGREAMSCRRERELELARLLLELDIDRSELDAVLARLLSMGHDVRVRDYKAAVEAIKNRHKDRNRWTETVLDEFFNVRSEWRTLFSAYNVTVAQADCDRP